MKSLKQCTPKVHKEFSIGKNKSYMKQLKNPNMILILVILAKLSAAVDVKDEVDCTEVADNKTIAFKCNNRNQVVDLSECTFNRSLLSISSCANVTGYFDVRPRGTVKFENIGILDVHMELPYTLQNLEFISIDRIVDVEQQSFNKITTLGLFKIYNARIDKFSADFDITGINRLKLQNVTIESLETINISNNGKELTIIDCHFKNINGPLNFHKFEKIQIERSVFIFSDFNNLSLAGNIVDLSNNSIVNAAIKIEAEGQASVHYTCGARSSMHIVSKNTSSTNNFLQWEITYHPLKKVYRDNNQICTKETCDCNYSKAGSIHSDIWYTLIFTVAFYINFSFGL